jgi:hypothetical protein
MQENVRLTPDQVKDRLTSDMNILVNQLEGLRDDVLESMLRITFFSAICDLSGNPGCILKLMAGKDMVFKYTVPKTPLDPERLRAAAEGIFVQSEDSKLYAESKATLDQMATSARAALRDETALSRMTDGDNFTGFVLLNSLS